MLGIELDNCLQDFILENSSDCNSISHYSFITKDEALSLPEILLKQHYRFSNNNELPSAGTFKRVISINCSAGVQFEQQLYSTLGAYCVNAIMTFWKNRITLAKFGRKYSQDFLANLKLLPKTTPIQQFFNSVTKPIIVFGSAQSIDDGIKYIKNSFENYFILCADTALQPLLANNIKVDGVFIEEAQNVILKAFIGTQSKDFQIFAGLSSTPVISHNFDLKNISFFTTEFTQAQFIETLKTKSFLPPINPPFGSVGLTTFYYALKFRKNVSIPVFIYGLDFSYTAGQTHGNGTLAHSTRLMSQNRLNSIYNYGSAFNNTTTVFTNNDGTKLYTTGLLKSYADLFNHLFADSPNCWNSSSLSNLIKLPFKLPESNGINEDKLNITTEIDYTSLYEWFNDEKNCLFMLRDILTGKISLSKEDASVRIKELAEPREYLYLHFPDGHQFSLNQDFLNRIRVQIDFFLKCF